MSVNVKQTLEGTSKASVGYADLSDKQAVSVQPHLQR